MTTTTHLTIRPFEVHVPEEDLANLRRRIAAWRPPEREPVDDQSQGVQLATMRDLANYWATEYDWRRCEAKLKTLEQFITSIDGLDVHFIHVRSPQHNALPLIVSHGWPGSVIEQLKIIEPLTNPTEHGGTASDAFDVVIPSLPGYGFSAKPAATGWGPDRIARAWAVLMQRLGYTRYVAQGGDWGTAISAAMARQAPEGLLGIHVNFAQMVPPGVLGHIRNGDPAPGDLSDAEKRAHEQVAFATYHRGYGVIQGTRPQTIGYSLADTPAGLADTPAGLAAWLLDHDTTQLPAPRPAVCRTPLRRHHARGLARQHLALLVHQYRHVRGAVVLAASPSWRKLLRRRRPVLPGRGHGVSGGVRPRAAQLDGEGVPQPDLLQRSRTRRPLRRLGTTATVLGRVARSVPHTALKETPETRSHRCAAPLS